MIPFRYEYTAGVAGEKFLRGLMEGQILAGYCAGCRKTSLPARMYCIECYSPIDRYVRAGPVGVVKAITRGTGASGVPETFAFVEFPGIAGGMVHRLLGRARVGSKVKASYKPKRERKGAVSDILGFERPR